MRKTKLLYSLALAPLLLGGYNYANVGQETAALTVTAIPTCPDGQFLVYRSGAVKCEVVQGSGVVLPNCEAQNQLLTYTKIGELSQYGCTRKGLLSLSTTDETTILDLQTKITQIGQTITQIGTGSRVASRTFRGTSSVSFDGAMGAGSGITAANAQCVKDFGVNASMCDVYSMYISIAAGKIDPTKADIPNAWVYQAAWTGSLPASDNCQGYTSGVAAGGFGTSFTLTAATGSAVRVPKFYTNTPCTTVQKVACCQ